MIIYHCRNLLNDLNMRKDRHMINTQNYENRIRELESQVYSLNEKVKDLEYQKQGIQCVLHDCFITLIKNGIINPEMKFYKDIIKARDC